MQAIQRMLSRVHSERSRHAIAQFIGLPPPTKDPTPEPLHRELARLSVKKLDETWTARPAQIQVLRNLLHGLYKPTRAEYEELKSMMVGRPLRDAADIVNQFLRGREAV